MNENTYDIVHVHRNQNHLEGGIAARIAKSNLPIVRTSRDGVALENNSRNMVSLSKLTDKLITVSEIVDNNTTGLVFKDTPENLATAILSWSKMSA